MLWTGTSTQKEMVFDRLAALKIATSNVSMHLDEAWRAGLFRQLDGMLDPEEWDFSEEMPKVASFKTLLRLVIHNQIKRRPSLGATSDGRIIAGWIQSKDRFTVECLPDDTVRWVLVKYIDGARTSSAGTSPVSLLHRFLEPYEPSLWFG